MSTLRELSAKWRNTAAMFESQVGMGREAGIYTAVADELDAVLAKVPDDSDLMQTKFH